MSQVGKSNLLRLFVEEHSRFVGEQLLGLRIIVRTPDIEPKTREGPGTYLFLRADQLQHKIRKIEILAWLDKAQHSRFVDINTHADIVAIFRFFAITRHAMIISKLKQAKVDFDHSPMRCNGKRRLLAPMKRNKLVKIQICKHVAVHDQERIRKTRDKRQRSRGPGRLVLFHEMQLQLSGQFLPMVKIGFDKAGKMAERQSDVGESECDKPPDQHLNDGDEI